MLTPRRPEAEISLFSIATHMLDRRRLLVVCAVAGAGIAAIIAFRKPPLYVATTSFVPQGTDNSQSSNLAALAGQFGVTLPSAPQSSSPDFYVKLLTSRVLLDSIAMSRIAVPELNNQTMRMSDLMEVKATDPDARLERTVDALRGRIATNIIKSTGIVQLDVATRWSSVSLAITRALLSGVNQFNVRKRQSQAAAERRFVDERLTIASQELHASEDRLAQFLNANRVIGSPELTFARDRLQRDVSMKQQVYSSLTQASEDVRIREVRDTPVITTVEDPFAHAEPEPRGRVRSTLTGGVLGAVVAVLIIVISTLLDWRRALGDADADAFMNRLDSMVQSVRPLRWSKRRRGADHT